MKTTQQVEHSLQCYHCGDQCSSSEIRIDEKIFCCNGCKTVYEILNTSNLCNYYSIESTPGISKRNKAVRNYDFLDDPDLIKQFADFDNAEITKINFTIPGIHCSSCVWILENLNKINPAIINSRVNFLRKTLSVTFQKEGASLKNIVELLDSIGYEPELNFGEINRDNYREERKKLYYKIGIAGFCFGNIMLLSFPEYLPFSEVDPENLKVIFSFISLFLSVPVLIFSAGIYFESAFKGLRKRIFNIDVPISLGILVLFLRSLFEILFQSGAGYLDSMSGLVFFLLLGRMFQNKTYDTLNFERNYKSYFPIAVTILKDNKETTIPLQKLEIE